MFENSVCLPGIQIKSALSERQESPHTFHMLIWPFCFNPDAVSYPPWQQASTGLSEGQGKCACITEKSIRKFKRRIFFVLFLHSLPPSLFLFSIFQSLLISSSSFFFLCPFFPNCLLSLVLVSINVIPVLADKFEL